MARSLSPLLRWRLPLALAIVALLTAAIIPAFAQGGPPAQPLLPNTEPAELAALTDGQALWTLGEREAVEATLAAFFASGQLTPPAGATFDLAELQGMSDAELSAVTKVYLPLVRRPPSLGELTPTPVTPTPVTPTPVTPTPVTPTPEPDPGSPANVAVTVWPKPSIWVAGGALLEYEIRLKNTGKGDADQITVVIPTNPAHMTFVNSSLDSKAGDFVSERTANRLTVTFGKLGPGKTRSGKVIARVASNLAYATVLDVRATYSWRDGVDGGGQRTNWTPVLVGTGSSDASYIWVQITPDRGVAGTQHKFYTNRFMPGETVSTWLNTPQGVRGLELRGVVDGEGAVSLTYASTGLARGTYQMVLYGQRSGLTGVATFIVQ